MQAVDVRETAVEAEESKADLARLVALVEESCVEDARALAAPLAAQWPDSAPIQHLRVALEPPTVTAVKGEVGKGRGRPLDRERAWLREYAHAYPACWLAIHENRLIAADLDRNTVVATARADQESRGVLLFFQPGGGSDEPEGLGGRSEQRPYKRYTVRL